VTRAPWAQPPLRALAWLYGAAVAWRTRRYDRPGAGRHAGLPVVSVGNLTVGGTGKTPFVAWLGRVLADAGERPAIVSRGYGGSAGRGPLVVSRGAGPLCDAALCGDEPFILARMLPDVPVVVGAERWAAARAAAELGSAVVLLDDGFQHRALARDLDIVLLDARDPFGGGRLLPAGWLREPPSALSRAGVVVITRTPPGMSIEPLTREIRAYNLRAPVLRATHRRTGFFDGNERPVEAPRRALVFCAVGQPQAFREDVSAAGVEIVAFESWRDHHRYDRKTISRLEARARALDAVLLTTEKDRVRIPSAADLFTLRIEMALEDPEPLLAAVRGVLQR
jgi:tetraacyldisaccharide 4'-kinase